MRFDLYQNYVKITWRNLIKQKLYASINIGGLAISLTAFLLIFLYLQHELSYDKFHKKAEQIYRVYRSMPGLEYLGSHLYAVSPAGLAEVLEEEVPEVERATAIASQMTLLAYEAESYYEEGLWVDHQFLSLFSYPILRGNPQTALQEPNSIVLTKSLTQKIFGSDDPMGKQIVYQNGDSFTVTGIVEDPPNNSSFQFTYLTSILSNPQYQDNLSREKWSNNSFHTFFTLADGTNPASLPDKLQSLQKKYVDYGEDFTYEESYLIQPLSELHLENGMNFDIGAKGNIQYINFFSILAIIIVLLACVNYVNLAITRSIRRTGEVGLRKVVGASRNQLVGQFIGESILITFLALLLALGLTYYLTPVFGHLVERPIALHLLGNPYLVPILVLLVAVVGTISGLYPALLISSLQPIHAIRNQVDRRFSGMRIQRWLLVGQYTVSIVLIIGCLVIYQQFQFIRNKELGYDKAHLLTLPVRDLSLAGKYEVLKSEWLRNPQIVSVTTSNDLPTNITSQTIINGDDERKDNDLLIYETGIGYDFLKAYDMKLMAGRTFSPGAGDLSGERYIINEKAAAALGWKPEEAVGKYLEKNEKMVVGVVQDFHLHSLHLKIEPLMLRLRPELSRYISIKIKPVNLPQTIAFLEQSFEAQSSFPFEYQFLDERFDQLYKTDRRIGELFGFFGVLSILIASLGLFGLAAFIARQRQKEISIRKVLGASVSNIATMLSRDFLSTVFLGFVIAIPIAWWVMHEWLNGFAYQITLQWWMFLLAGMIAIFMASITIGAQSIKAAAANPVDALKDQ